MDCKISAFIGFGYSFGFELCFVGFSLHLNCLKTYCFTNSSLPLLTLWCLSFKWEKIKILWNHSTSSPDSSVFKCLSTSALFLFSIPIKGPCLLLPFRPTFLFYAWLTLMFYVLHLYCPPCLVLFWVFVFKRVLTFIIHCICSHRCWGKQSIRHQLFTTATRNHV